MPDYPPRNYSAWARLEAFGPVGVDWGFDGTRYWAGVQLFGWRPSVKVPFKMVIRP